MRLDTERQEKLEPVRADYARAALVILGLEIVLETKKEIRFIFKGATIRLFPYSGWFTGKTVKDGRGIENLIKQLK